MPTYQYACTDCDHAFEQVQSFTEDSLTACPSCEGRLRKVFNAVGVVFKGSGFYRTDSRSESTSSTSESTTKSGSKGDSKNGSKNGSSGTSSSPAPAAASSSEGSAA